MTASDDHVIDLFSPATRQRRRKPTNKDGTMTATTADEMWSPPANYDKRAFYFKSETRGAPGQQMNAKLPPVVIAEMDRLIHLRSLPLLSKSDIVRDAIIHRLWDYAQMLAEDEPLKGELEDFVQLQLHLSSQDRHQRIVSDRRKLIDGYKQLMSDLAEFGDWIELCGVIERAWHSVDVMNPPYSTQLKAIIRTYIERVPDGYRSYLPTRPD